MAALRIWMTPYRERHGSICCLARNPASPGSLYILSAGHVVAPLEFERVGDVERANITIECEFPGAPPRTVGRLFDWQVIDYSGLNPFDVGLVEVYRDAEQNLLEALPLPTGFSSLAEPGWDICTLGAQTQEPRTGKILEARVDPLRYAPPGSASGASFKPENHFSTDRVSVEHDSGAPAFDTAGKLVGLLVGGRSDGEGRSYFVRAAKALGRFGLKPVLHSEHLAGVSAASLWSQAPAAPLAAVARTPAAEVDVLARTLWGEARGEGRAGIEGVACVVLNRAARGPKYWWGGTIVDVCKRPKQFSCWNPGDANVEQLKAVTADNVAFRTCIDVAQAAVDGRLADATSGATHYHVNTIMPPWARGKVPCAHIGHHLFYNDIE